MAEKTNLHNPWIEDSFCPLKTALLLAENTGHLGGPATTSSEPQTCTSLQLIGVLKSIDRNGQTYNKLKAEIQERMLDKETSDVTHLHVLDKKLKEIEVVNSYLQRVVDHKQNLITRVQQPLVGDHIKLHATSHEHAVEFFKQIASILADLSTNLNNLDWIGTQNFSNTKLDGVLDNVTASLASLQTEFTGLCGLHSGMRHRYLNDSTSHT